MASDFEYYQMLERIPLVVSDYLNGLTCEQIAKKRGIAETTIIGYLKNKTLIETLYGLKAKDTIEAIKKQRAANIRANAIKIDMRRIATAEKGKSK